MRLIFDVMLNNNFYCNLKNDLLQVIKTRRTHVNAVNLLERLRMMVTVHQTQPTIQLLLSTSEYAGSLDLIRTTQEVLHQELAGLQCFRYVVLTWLGSNGVSLRIY